MGRVWLRVLRTCFRPPERLQQDAEGGNGGLAGDLLPMLRRTQVWKLINPVVGLLL
jgi:hypothetical protein